MAQIPLHDRLLAAYQPLGNRAVDDCVRDDLRVIADTGVIFFSDFRTWPLEQADFLDRVAAALTTAATALRAENAAETYGL